jgi:hypothetical protein
LKNILLYRLLLVNTIIGLWFGFTNFQTSWLTSMFATDTSKVTWLLGAWFVLVLILTLKTAWHTNKASNRLKGNFVWNIAKNPPRGMIREKEILWIEWAAASMFVLGLIGTLLGLGISLAKVNTGALNDPEGIKAIATQLLIGLRVELSATIIGAMVGLWTELNYQILYYVTAQVADREDEMLMDIAAEKQMVNYEDDIVVDPDFDLDDDSGVKA